MIKSIEFTEVIPVNNQELNISLLESNYTSGNISLYELFVLNVAVKVFDPKRILEFGTFNGRTTLNLISNASKSTKITTVDLPKNKLQLTKYPLEAKQNYEDVDELGYVGVEKKLYEEVDPKIRDRIIQIWSDTAEFKSNKKYDFIFVDASHSYQNTINDSKNAINKFSTDNAIIFLHDYNGWPGVTRALNELYELESYDLKWINGTSLVILKKGE